MAPQIRIKNRLLPSSQDHIAFCAGVSAKVPDTFPPMRLFSDAVFYLPITVVWLLHEQRLQFGTDS